VTRPLAQRTISSRRLAALLGLLAATVAIGLIVNGESSSKPRGNSPTASATATVERRDLVEIDTEAGTLSYADPQTVYDRLNGTLTWLPSAGQVIKPGGTLFTVDGRPVTLMDGSVPAYRELAPGVGAGRDVAQLNRNLLALGDDPDGIALDDEWQAATTAGVEQLQASLGETQTGKLTFGQIVFLPGDQLVSNVEATLGGDGASSGSSNPSASSASDPASAAGREYASLETPTSSSGGMPPRNPTTDGKPTSHRHPQRTSTRRLEALIARLKGEINELKSADAPGARSPKTPTTPDSSNSNDPSNSPGGASPSPILQTTSTRLVVTVELDASKQSEARVGESVTVELPNGESANGGIAAVSPVAKSSSGNPTNNGSGGQGNGGNGSGGNGSGSVATIPVTITLNGRHAGAGLDQAAVSVDFSRATARDVLSVPVTALLATGGASYAVQEAAARHRLIPVTAGLFAAGFAQISGSGVYPGLQVSDSQG
jgi:hypothetical protein